MANYRISDIVRLTRKAKGLSQEELAFEAGIAVKTISRIESGKHKVTQATYQKVMDALNRFGNRSYAVCTSKDVGIMEERKLLEDATVKYEFKQAEEYLEDLKEKADDTILNKQYILRVESLLDYCNEKISAEVMVERLKAALHLTVENYQDYMSYSQYKEEGYPYTEQEILILMNLAGAYVECKQYRTAEKVLYVLTDCLDSGYIVGEEISNLKIVIKSNLSRAIQGQRRYEESMGVLEDVLEEAIKKKYGMVIVKTFYDIIWNMTKLNEVREKEEYTLEEIKRKMRQVYYIAAARKDEHMKLLAQNLYEKVFCEKIIF